MSETTERGGKALEKRIREAAQMLVRQVGTCYCGSSSGHVCQNCIWVQSHLAGLELTARDELKAEASKAQAELEAARQEIEQLRAAISDVKMQLNVRVLSLESRLAQEKERGDGLAERLETAGDTAEDVLFNAEPLGRGRGERFEPDMQATRVAWVAQIRAALSSSPSAPSQEK